ncbi:MAG: molybdopterin molybdotransferase MoeA [Acidimicrobiia bacterium]|nr:molybdopterin molybdotransferase MoeA [Acidimicrobiia bacterium]
MKPLAEAQRQVLAAVGRLPSGRVPVWSSVGLVLADDVIATQDVPPFPNSAMDGYAVKGADVAAVPTVLRVLEDVAAGHVGTATVEPGTAVKIMTGAPIPPGADTIVKVEDTEPGDGAVRIMAVTEPGTSVREAGGDVRSGDLVFDTGTRLTPAHLGVLAAIGVAEPTVFRRPRVAVMSTGDEVLAPESPRLAPGQIRDANRPLLTGLLSELGAEVHDYGIVVDDATLLRSTLLRAAEECDVVMTSGGVSMGEYDLVKAVLTELGDIELWRVAMQPAKPFAFGQIRSTPLFGLPGNPVSVLVAFEQFARPALLSMMGSRLLFRPRLRGVLAHDVHTDPEKTVFLRMNVTEQDGRWVAASAGGQSSNVLSAAANANGFAVVPVGTGSVDEGSVVELEMFRWSETRTYEDVLG